MKNNLLIFTFGFFVLPVFGWAQSAPDFKELLDSAMIRDSDLKMQITKNKLTDLDEHKLKDIFLPTLEVSGQIGYINATARLTSPEINLQPFITIPEGRYNNNLNVSGFSGIAKTDAKMLLYSGGKVKYLKKAVEEKKVSEDILLEKTRDEVVAGISKAYDQLALIHQSKRVLDESKKRLDINRKTADKALGYGLITPYDHKKIELAQATLNAKIVEYEGKKELLLTQLYILTGISKERLRMIEPVLSPVDMLVSEKGIEERAEIRALDHGIVAADYKIKAERTWMIPKVQLMASAYYIGLYGSRIKTSENVIPAVPALGYQGAKLDWRPTNINILPLLTAGVGFKWEIFDGREGKHAEETAKIGKEVLQNQKEDALKKLTLNLANNQTNYDIATAQITLKSKEKELAKNALVQAEKEFRYGMSKSSQLIEAESDLEMAELEYQNAIFNQRRAGIELMRSTQELDIAKLY
ncbi:ABC transporter permease [Chryseobacterium piperi]|uniref:ABC transporter permease n=1 Tax=Chryseobacterium piperi TaxID=558152 RepID=A0A086B4I9_9FLAO|nr:TolC family protein [Chryseobacterium piperi]ASW73125.1 TolC family protein [Chryseobacterium piperi]KFF23853.1 ABC transporter permease [Chryseobacterium piperi]